MFRAKRRPAAWSIPLLLLAMVRMSSSLFAQGSSVSSTPYVIFGNVRLPDGAPARQIPVMLTNMTGFDRRTFTDDGGRYELRDLPRGHYYLSASNPKDPDQVSDNAEVDTSRVFITRITANLYLRYRSMKTVQQPSDSPVISARESAQHVPRKALKSFNQGIKSSQEGRFKEAEREFTRAIEIFPDYFQALSERGSLYVALGRLAEAGRDFKDSLKINPEYGPALRGSGICEFHAGKYTDALSYLEKAVAAEPNVAKDYMLLGLTYGALDRWGAARMAFQQALSLDPKGFARAHFHLANIYIRENRTAEAINELDAYLAALPEAPDREKVITLQSQLRGKM